MTTAFIICDMTRKFNLALEIFFYTYNTSLAFHMHIHLFLSLFDSFLLESQNNRYRKHQTLYNIHNNIKFIICRQLQEWMENIYVLTYENNTFG